MRDQIGDMITRIRNGQKVRFSEVILYTPTSKLCIHILNILRTEGYVHNYKIKKIHPLQVSVILKFDSVGKPAIKNIYQISTIGRRIYIKSKNLWTLKSGQGLFIISTPKGLMTNRDAKINNYGGELLLNVY
jgi:small subunit ribosomal protein S8